MTAQHSATLNPVEISPEPATAARAPGPALQESANSRALDPGDALVLARIMRTDMHAHRPLPQDSELARAVVVLARAPQQDGSASPPGGGEGRGSGGEGAAVRIPVPHAEIITA